MCIHKSLEEKRTRFHKNTTEWGATGLIAQSAVRVKHFLIALYESSEGRVVACPVIGYKFTSVNHGLDMNPSEEKGYQRKAFGYRWSVDALIQTSNFSE